MKSKKTLPLAISAIILVVFLALSFTLFDASTQVAIAGVRGSYAQKYANENDIDFIELYDSDNPDVAIPKIEKEAKKETKKDTVKEENASVKTEKENELFGYNYEGKTVNVAFYKGDDSIVIIPNTIDNLPVTKVSMNVLHRGILAVYIPQSVTSIDTTFKTARYTDYFWAVNAVMVAGFIFAVISTIIGLKKEESAEGTFYGISFVYSGLVTYIGITVWSAVSLFFGFSPLLHVLIATIVFTVAVIGLVKRSAARNAIEARGEEIKQQTRFIKLLTADAETLVSAAKTNETKALAKKVYEAIRYSDPMSTPEIGEIESNIQDKFNSFALAVKNDDIDTAQTAADELTDLLKERNNKCKVMK